MSPLAAPYSAHVDHSLHVEGPASPAVSHVETHARIQSFRASWLLLGWNLGAPGPQASVKTSEPTGHPGSVTYFSVALQNFVTAPISVHRVECGVRSGS